MLSQEWAFCHLVNCSQQVDLPKIDHEDEEMEEDGNLSSVDKEVARLDESKLNRQQRNSGSKESREKIDADFKQDIEARKETLARVAPNLKAVDQYEDAKVEPCKILLGIICALAIKNQPQGMRFTLICRTRHWNSRLASSFYRDLSAQNDPQNKFSTISDSYRSHTLFLQSEIFC